MGGKVGVTKFDYRLDIINIICYIDIRFYYRIISDLEQ